MSKFQDAASVKLPRVTKGKRPYFFEDPSIDQLMTFFMELMTEVQVLRDRQDTVERVLDEKGTLNRADLRAFIPTAEIEIERSQERDAFVKRVLRIHTSEGRQDD